MANRLTTQKNKIPKHKKPAVVKVSVFRLDVQLKLSKV